MTEQKKSNPVLLDRVIQDIQEYLEKELKWLDFAFGRSYRIEEPKGDKSYTFPAIYLGANEYQSVLPDDSLGNFSFFELYDPTEVDNTNKTVRVSTKGAIIFWLNFFSIYPDASMLYPEEIKAEIIRALQNCRLSSGHLKITKLYEQPANIYKGYDIKQIDNQYLMSPYYGLRVEIELSNAELCRH